MTPVRPRALRIITRLNVGGPATHVTVADKGLRQLGWETLLVHGTVEPDETEIPLDDLDLPMHRVAALARPLRPLPDAKAFAAITSIIRDYRPHIIHTHLSKAGLLGRGAAIVASRAVRIHTFHGTVFEGYFGASMSGAIRRAERILGGRTDYLIALSERQREELLAHRVAPASRIRIVPLGLELGRFAGVDRGVARAALGISEETLAVVAIGRLVPIKRLDRLLRAVALASGRVPSLHLYVVGDGSERAPLERLASSLEIRDRVTFVGWCTNTPLWYGAADVVALTSDREGTPLALIEASAAGRATIATNVGGVADVVADGETGLVVDPADEAGLANGIARLALDPGLRIGLGRAARDRSKGFSADRLVSDLDRLYREALSKRGMLPHNGQG